MAEYDAVVVGTGPNGLAAAIELAQAGLKVIVYEGKDTIGGGMRTEALTLPGFLHDVCSAIHPLGMGSPFFRRLPLDKFGLEWIQPDLALAHPLDDGSAGLMAKSLDETAEYLGRDGSAYKNLMGPFARRWNDLADDVLGPFPFPPKHLITLARFGIPALLPAQVLVNLLFKTEQAKGMFAGLAGHSFLPLNLVGTASFGMMLGILGHAVGWPLPRGGSQQIANAMAAYLSTLGGEIVTGRMIESIDELPPAKIVMFDVGPKQLLKIAGHKLPDGYRRALEGYRYGPGIFKIDYALSEPVPWKNPDLRRAGTVHLGGTFDQVARGEADAYYGRLPEKPLVLIAQQSLFDSTRAPEGKHTLWAYCHVPAYSTVDMTDRIEAQIERFAPGFRDVVLHRATRNTQQVEMHNPNYFGGDINGGAQDLLQQWTRPVARPVPYSTPLKGVYLCSSSTPPGGGVHGMCGYHAARAALKSLR
jgi:phytoene dehydrogenase-like protein